MQASNALHSSARPKGQEHAAVPSQAMSGGASARGDEQTHALERGQDLVHTDTTDLEALDALDALEARTPRGPHRRCIATGDVTDKGALLRFVISPDGVVTFDPQQRLPGRGIWVLPTLWALTQASAKGGFKRAARRKVKTPEDLTIRVATTLQTLLFNQLGLARRSGALVLGSAKVEAALAASELSALWFAADTSPQTLEQWQNKLSKHRGLPPAQVTALVSQDLAVTLGRANVVVMGLVRQSKAKSATPATMALHQCPQAMVAVPPLGNGWHALRRLLQHYLNLASVIQPQKEPNLTQEAAF